MLLDKQKAKYLKAKVKYEAGTPTMSDAAFDALERTIAEADPTWKGLKQVGAPIGGSKKKVKLEQYMPSLSKAYPEKIDKWLAKREGPYTVMHKLDGSSLLLTYDNGKPESCVTRGDGSIGQDISFMLPYLNIPRKIKIKDRTWFRCEAVMDRKVFASKYAKDYDNPRNLVAGILNRVLRKGEVPDLAINDIRIVVLGVIDRASIANDLMWAQQEKFDIVEHSVLTKANAKSLSKLYATEKENAATDIDGLVLMPCNEFLIYESTKNPTFAVAFKENLSDDEAPTATVKEVIWQTSHSGRLTPKVRITPTVLDGATITFATAHNAKWLIDRGIGKGAKIKLVRSGGVIPKIQSVVKPTKELTYPAVPYLKKGVHFIAKHDSLDQEIKRIYHYMKTVGVEKLAKKTIASIYAATAGNPRALTSIYRWTKLASKSPIDIAKTLRLYGVGPKNSVLFATEIQKLRTPDILKAMVGSSAFPELIGETRLRVLQNKMQSLVALDRGMNEIELLVNDLPGIKPDGSTAHAMLKGIRDFLPVYRRLIKAGAEFTEILPTTKKSVKGKMNGQLASWTGYRNKEEEAAFESMGGTVIKFGAKTTILFYKEGVKSKAKVERAQAKGINTYLWSNFLKG